MRFYKVWKTVSRLFTLKKDRQGPFLRLELSETPPEIIVCTIWLKFEGLEGEKGLRECSSVGKNE